MSHFDKNLLFIGKVNLDVGAVGDVDSLGDTKDFATGGMHAAIGGASANAARAARKLARVYGDEQNTKIVTRMGQEPAQESYSNFGEYLLARHAREMTRELMEHEGFNHTDVSVGQPGPGVAKSIVSTFQGGRHIFKDMPLAEQFNAANDGMISNVKNQIHAEISTSGFVFLDPARPALADIAIGMADQTDAVMITDYGFKSISKDQKEAERIDNILKNSDIVIVPGDAFVEGMIPGEKNPDKLFELLQDKQYKARTIIMSDGLDPVRVYHEGKVSEIPVTPAPKLVNVNGAGDTRDGALMFYLSRGDEMIDAVAKASAVSSIRMQYQEHEWEDRFYDHVKDNPLFASDIADIEHAREMKIQGFVGGPAANDDKPYNEGNMEHG